MVAAHAQFYGSLAAHTLTILFFRIAYPVNPFFRRLLGCSWRRVEDCYPYPCD